MVWDIWNMNIFVIYIQTRLKELDVILKVKENSIVFNEK
jgi:hypothetical protein